MSELFQYLQPFQTLLCSDHVFFPRWTDNLDENQRVPRRNKKQLKRRQKQLGINYILITVLYRIYPQINQDFKTFLFNHRHQLVSNLFLEASPSELQGLKLQNSSTGLGGIPLIVYSSTHSMFSGCSWPACLQAWFAANQAVLAVHKETCALSMHFHTLYH